VLDGDKNQARMGAVINETDSPYHAYHGLGNGTPTTLCPRARFEAGKLVEKALVQCIFTGKKGSHQRADQSGLGGPNSGLDGGNDEAGHYGHARRTQASG